MDELSRVIRLPPYQYLHVLDTNNNVTRVLSGPQTYTRQDHEKIVSGPSPMIIVPPQSYVVIENPVVRSVEGIVIVDSYGQAKLRHGEREVRTSTQFTDPFPLYAGEIVSGSVQKLTVLDAKSALRIRANRDFDNHAAGDEWHFVGPATYLPRIEEDVVGTIKASVIKKNQALKLRADKKCVDCFGITRDAGEEWLVRDPGTYMPRVDESVLGVLNATILTDKASIYLRALRTFKDIYGIQRKAGEEWLVTSKMAETHVQDVHEEIISHVPITTLTNRQYCIVLDPIVNGNQQLGTRELRRGETSFFLQPGETLENGIQDVCILADDEAVLLQANESFLDKDANGAPLQRLPGVKWMVYGPCEYVPPIQVNVLEIRKAIPLDKNEGIYVRDTKTGKVRAECGQTYMLQPTEELWEKKLPDEVEELLRKDAYVDDNGIGRGVFIRDATRVVTFEVPHNTAIQIYDYSSTMSRILFGPTLVMLSPDEQFMVMKLSGDVPKRVKVIKTLCLQLGPDFMRDQITVETSDHARLRLTIAYNWHFQIPSKQGESPAKIFSVRDFVGDACKTLASRIRGAVAVETFDHFHKHSAQIIRSSIFGLDENGEPKSELMFPTNNLCITNVDIQSAEPVDAQTRDSLQKSVQLAIEITTKSQEAKAKAIAMKEDEEAKGLLVTQQLENQTEAEKARKRLVELSAQCAAVEAEGAAVATAKAKAQAAEIEALAAVKQAELRVQAMQIEHDSQMLRLQSEHELEIQHAKQMAELEIQKKRELIAIEADKFKSMVDTIGQQTIVEMARAGPEAQVKLLASLGLQGYLITDGKSPVNLVNTAQDLIRNITSEK
ncbi:major vault protein [Thraustotheca clavata]|uniref:Major vault protein n=1 Tax=Thraustotheca clavata TaxID=74557 RepID=A0A1V9ZHK7_9STRA|nr:major vault protein [Thraustotheca clavata]